MNFSILKELIATKPAGVESDADIALWCNTPSITKQVKFMFTVRTAMSSLGPVLANTILTKLESASAENEILARTLNMIQPSEGGIDVGHPATCAQIDALVSAAVLETTEGEALKALGITTVSPASDDGLGVVTPPQVAYARAIP